MNGKIKFHKPSGPAFNPGEVWVSTSGSKVEIVSVQKYAGATTDQPSDYSVTYKTDPKNKPELTGKKDGWDFQVRYTHQADVGLKGKK